MVNGETISDCVPIVCNVRSAVVITDHDGRYTVKP